MTTFLNEDLHCAYVHACIILCNSGGSLKQGVWGAAPEALQCLMLSSTQMAIKDNSAHLEYRCLRQIQQRGTSRYRYLTRGVVSAADHEVQFVFYYNTEEPCFTENVSTGTRVARAT